MVVLQVLIIKAIDVDTLGESELSITDTFLLTMTLITWRSL